jgi:hypothetical protein
MFAGDGGFTKDDEAFVFNLNEKFLPSSFENAMFHRNNGF